MATKVINPTLTVKSVKRWRTKEYTAWGHMLRRCLNPNDISYESYGGRGITVCDEWKESFDNFFLDMGPAPTPSHSLDRIDNSKGYYKENCRWATSVEQNRNTRKNRRIEYNGRSMTYGEWAQELGYCVTTLKNRIDVLGWPVEKAFTHPVRPKSPCNAK